MKNSQKKLVQGGALDARKKLGEVTSPGISSSLLLPPEEISFCFFDGTGTNYELWEQSFASEQTNRATSKRLRYVSRKRIV